MTFDFIVLLRHLVLCHNHFFLRQLIATFYLYVGDLDGQSIFDQTKTINQNMIINMLQNCNHMYFNVTCDFIVLLQCLVLCHRLITMFCFSSACCNVLSIYE